MSQDRSKDNVVRVAVGIIALLAIIFGTNPPSRTALLTYIVFLAVSVLVYKIKAYKRLATGITLKNAPFSIIVGMIVAFSFYFVLKLVPGFSLGLPLLPNAISDSLKFLIVVLIAPFVEEIFFRGSLLAYIREYNPSESKIQRAILLQAVLFALGHLSAYVFGFYDYSSITEGISALSANVSVFISAGLFGYLAGFLVTRKAEKFRNLLITIALHITINFIIFTKFAIGIFQ